MQTAWETYHTHADRVIALMTEPGVTPAAIEHAEDLSRLWLYLAETLDGARQEES